MECKMTYVMRHNVDLNAPVRPWFQQLTGHQGFIVIVYFCLLPLIVLVLTLWCIWCAVLVHYRNEDAAHVERRHGTRGDHHDQHLSLPPTT